MLVNGTVRADGLAGQYISGVSGGGAGGSIRLDIGWLGGSGSITARGGDGTDGGSGYSGAGGGGRIAAYFSALTLPSANFAVAGGAGTSPGSAGTIYLKDVAAGAGDVIVDNSNRVSSLSTLVSTSLPSFRDVISRNNARVLLGPTQRITTWAQSITLSGGTLSASDTLRLQGTVLRGTGTVATRLVNNGEVSPGASAGTVGQIVCSAGYQQGVAGVLRADIASASSFDRVRVTGGATLSGDLAYQYLGGYAPPPNTRFPVLTSDARTDTFATLTGADATAGVAYLDSTTVLIPGIDRTPPQTMFVGGLADGGWTNATSQAFDWTGTDDTSLPAALLFAYQLDSDGWSALGAGTSHAFAGLTAGAHTVSVRAVDELGNADPTPATRTFTVDVTVPTLVYGSGPADGDTVRSMPIAFTLRGSDDMAPASGLTYSWSVDGAAYTTPSTDTTATLNITNDGIHTLSSRAHDLAGNASTTVTRSWYLNLPPQDLVVASAITITQDTTFNSITVQSGGTLTARRLTVLTDMAVASGGVVTHAQRDTAGLRLTVSGTLDVQSGGAIDATGKGLSGGTGVAAGETFGAGDAIVAGAGGGANYGAGASYGGPGGNTSEATTNAAYGLVEDARHLGSGGGGSAGATGGAGGGRIRISAAAVVVNGAIRADGAAGQHGSGGTSGAGSGGSIWIDTGDVAGTTGQITANGGAGANGWSAAAAGGGGRLAIFYSSATGANGLNVLCVGGQNTDPTKPPSLQGGAGTGYFKDNAQAKGEVEINNAGTVAATPTRLLTGLATLRQVRVHDQGALALISTDVPSLTLDYGLLIWNTGVLDVGSGVSLAIAGGQRLDIGGLSTATFELGSTLIGDDVRVGGGTLNAHTDLPLAGTGRLELSNSGTLNLLDGKTLSLAVFDTSNVHEGTLNIAPGSRLEIVSNRATVGNRVTLIKDGVFGAFGASDSLDALTVLSGGVVTHGARNLNGLRLGVGTIDVRSGGAIDVSGKGLNGGTGVAAGETYGANDAIVAGAYGGANYGAGASYGGPGANSSEATSNAPYGLLEEARHLGSGGGGSIGATGGPGGGFIRINTGTLTINGAIRADGGAGQHGSSGTSGAGSGGSILIHVGHVTGTTGAVTAYGGAGANGWPSAAAGGGGRIAIYYNSSDQTDSIEWWTAGGLNTAPTHPASLQGGAGTFYVKDDALASGDLFVDNGDRNADRTTPLLTVLPALHDLHVDRSARLNLSVTQRVTSWIRNIILGGGTLSASDTLRLQGTVLGGSGTIATRLVNNGEVAPGDTWTPVGQIVCAADYEQGASGVLRADVAGASNFDRLRITGGSVLGGQLAHQYLSGYAPASGARFPVLSYGTHVGTFATVTGTDTTSGVAYFDTTAAVIRNIDRTPPQTVFASGLADSAWTNVTSQTFGWSGTDDTSPPVTLRYAYQLDSGGWSALSTGTSHVFSGLTAGAHTVSVDAVDEVGNADPTPATRSFTVDLVAPTVAFGSGPADGDTVRTTSTAFTLRGSDDLAPVTALRYAYSLDGAAYTTPVTDTTVTLTITNDGAHTLAVRASDLAGNTGTSVSRSWFTMLPPRDLVVASAVSLPRDTTFNSITVQSGGTLTASGAVSVLTDMTVLSGGLVTHAVRDTAGLRLDVSGTLDVQSGGLIDVTGKGLSGGVGNGVAGETFDSNGAIVSGASGAYTYGSGASYGGTGTGSTNAAYGLLDDPRQLGSGGGGALSATGGKGGGRIRIVAGTLNLNGVVRANGVSGGTQNGVGGSGSGGAIRIDAETVSGSGQVVANGGNSPGVWPTGVGGGGRIAVYYTGMTLASGNLVATGGTGPGVAGSAGTIYLKDAAQANGDVIVDNASILSPLTAPLRTTANVLRSLTLRNGGSLQIASADKPSLEVEQPIAVSDSAVLEVGPAVGLTVSNASGFDVLVTSGSTLTLQPGSNLAVDALQINNSTLNASSDIAVATGSDFELSNGGTVNLQGAMFSVGSFDATNVKSGTFNLTSGSRLNVTTGSLAIGSGVTLVKDGALGASDQVTTLTVASGGLVTHAVRDTAGLRLDVSGTLDVQSGGLIDVTGKGLSGGVGNGVAGETFDSNGAIVSGAGGAYTYGSGASYGGTGTGSTNTAYGLLDDPRQVGAGGGGAANVTGGKGGGRVRIVAGTLNLDGVVRANGMPGGTGNGVGGGGSGGAIRIDAGTVSGSGQVVANGGNSPGVWPTGVGGGGRIAVYYTGMTLASGNLVATGGTGPGVAGSAGTIYLKDAAQTNGDVIVDNASVNASVTTTLLTSMPTLRDVILRNSARLSLDATQRITTWAQIITLSNATLSAADTLRLQGTILRGVGTVATRLVNNGEVSPGRAATPVGQIVCAAGYQQGATGVLRTEASGASTSDRLRIVGAADLGWHARPLLRERVRAARGHADAGDEFRHGHRRVLERDVGRHPLLRRAARLHGGDDRGLRCDRAAHRVHERAGRELHRVWPPARCLDRVARHRRPLTDLRAALCLPPRCGRVLRVQRRDESRVHRAVHRVAHRRGEVAGRRR